MLSSLPVTQTLKRHPLPHVAFLDAEAPSKIQSQNLSLRMHGAHALLDKGRQSALPGPESTPLVLKLKQARLGRAPTSMRSSGTRATAPST